MLERYFARPVTIDGIRSSWIGGAIEQYVTWLTEQGYAARNVFHRVPVLRAFGEFAKRRGATAADQLPAHVDAFVETWMQEHGTKRTPAEARRKVESAARNPVEQMLRLAVPGFVGRRRARSARNPFENCAGGFFEYLRDERGLRDASFSHYRQYLAQFEAYLARIACADLAAISAPVLGAFVADGAEKLAPTSMRDRCGVLRVFLRYLYRERVIPKDLSDCVEKARSYRLSTLPRSIAWDDVRRMLEAVDRRTVVGRRDYAILVLLVTYGLRGREVAAMTLDDIDWKRDRIRIPERKAGHSTGYPLSPTVG